MVGFMFEAQILNLSSDFLQRPIPKLMPDRSPIRSTVSFKIVLTPEQVNMHRRNFIKTAATVAVVSGIGSSQDLPSHNWDRYDFGPGPTVAERLDQGPFGIEQDQGWYTVMVTSQSDKPIRNYGTGLVGYTWEEGGPSLAAREGKETLEQHVDRLSSLPFVDVLYIRCDWRDVQSRQGRLNLHPVFKLTFD